MNESAVRLHLSLTNDPAALEPARQAVLRFLAPCELPAPAVHRIELVLEEIVMNAIAHAFPEGGARSIELEVRVRPDAVVLEFEDDGVPFDPLHAPEPALPTSMAQATPGGRGLMLVRRLARAARYRHSDGRNHLSVDIARA